MAAWRSAMPLTGQIYFCELFPIRSRLRAARGRPLRAGLVLPSVSGDLDATAVEEEFARALLGDCDIIFDCPLAWKPILIWG
jgi:hypothetical protein